MSTTSSDGLTYMPQLDSLRAIAVSMVVFSHWAGFHDDAWRDTFWFNGQLGVQLFFVLSGFLITGILLKERGKVEARLIPQGRVLRAFYIRRVLRIFPLFYATLFITALYGDPYVRQSLHWHVTYLSNVLFALRGEYLETVSHFWSLAVEEQFYLFWPLLVLFVSEKKLLPMILLTILAAPMFRLVTSFWLGLNPVAVNVLPFSNLDTLGIGALLAYVRSGNDDLRKHSLGRAMKIVSILSFPLFVGLGIYGPGSSPLTEFLFRTIHAPMLLGIVWVCAEGVRGVAGRMLSHPLMTYPGRISYGIYVLHFFVAFEIHNFFFRNNWIGWKTEQIFAFLAINLTVLLGICSFSWYFFESRLIALKRYFPYSRVPLGPGLDTAVGSQTSAVRYPHLPE